MLVGARAEGYHESSFTFPGPVRMNPAKLLVVDGESLRTPGMLDAFQAAGWELDFITSLQIQLDFVPEAQPDMLLLGAPVFFQGEEGVRDVTNRFPGLPVVAVGTESRAGMEGVLAGHLDTSRPVATWPEQLEALAAQVPGAGAHQLSSEDIFGDILADLDGREPVAPSPAWTPAPTAPPTASPAPVAPESSPSRAASPAAPKPVAPPARPVGLPGVPKPVAPKAPLPAAARPVPLKPMVPSAGKPPVPAVASKAEPAPDVAAGTARDEIDQILGIEPPAPKPLSQVKLPVDVKVEEFTLSGLSGIHDPFGAEASPAKPEVPAPAPVPVSTPAPEKPMGRPGLYDSQQMPILEEFGNYYLLEKIAVGGMAELFRARQRGVHDFQKIVAIKRILPHLSDNDEFVRMFIDEAKLAAQLTHPNIAQIFDLGKVGNFYYIAMEFVDGRDLRSMLRRSREYKLPFPEAVAAFVTMKVAGALDYAHRKRGMDDKDLKLVHRDISPQNILISNDGAVKLVDFGIAKAATKSTQTVAGALKGKLLYMSPEQALGKNLDHRSDIYSLGLVLFELLTGERCFQADSELGVLEKVRMGKVLDVKSINPAISDEMAGILARALEKDVDRRYASARLLERDLKSLLTHHRNEPAEHDVAEFASILLKGTRVQVDLLISSRFPAVVSATSPKVPPVVVAPAGPTAVMVPEASGDEATSVKGPAMIVPLPEPPEAMTAPGRPAWVVPALLVLAAAAVTGIWLALR